MKIASALAPLGLTAMRSMTGEAPEALRPGAWLEESRWFDVLPEKMAFREDYLPAFTQRRMAEANAAIEFKE